MAMRVTVVLFKVIDTTQNMYVIIKGDIFEPVMDIVNDRLMECLLLSFSPT